MSDTATATVEAPTVPAALKASVVKAIGAAGVWSEWIEENGKRYFTDQVAAAATALESVGPVIRGMRKTWAKVESKPEERYTFETWLSAARTIDEAWQPDAIETARVESLFVLTQHEHKATTMSHYVKVCAADPTTMGVADFRGYLKWLPTRADYLDINGKALDQKSPEAVKAAANKLAARKAEEARKASKVLCSDVTWDTMTVEGTTDLAKAERRLAMAHDFLAYANAQVDKLGEDDAKKVRTNIANALKATPKKATPRKAK
jgi:hypothetical protein